MIVFNQVEEEKPTTTTTGVAVIIQNSLKMLNLNQLLALQYVEERNCRSFGKPHHDGGIRNIGGGNSAHGKMRFGQPKYSRLFATFGHGAIFLQI